MIYRHGLDFGKAGSALLRDENSFVPAMINILLATEIFLKSLNATSTSTGDVDETGLYIGNDATVEIKGSGSGHSLRKLFEGLPKEMQEGIKEIASKSQETITTDIVSALEAYDKTFTEWRYIYEQRDPRALSSHPITTICNAIEEYCRTHEDEIIICEVTG